MTQTMALNVLQHTKKRSQQVSLKNCNVCSFTETFHMVMGMYLDLTSELCHPPTLLHTHTCSFLCYHTFRLGPNGFFT